MNVIHITPSTAGYEIVKLISNAVNKTNSLTVIKKDDGNIYYTGGFIIKDTTQIRNILDSIPKGEQYKFVEDFKVEPFVDYFYEK